MKSKNNGKDFGIFALPGIFFFLAVVMVPFVYGAYLTLTDWNGVSNVKNFVAFKNFGGVVKDAQFWTSLLLTFRYVILVVVIVNILAFAIAYLLTRGMKGQNFFRAGFFTPNLIGGIVLGYIWQFVFSRVFVSIGESTGWSLFEVSWLSDPTNAFIALVVVSVWQLSGYMILIYVAGFMGLNADVMEAASIYMRLISMRTTVILSITAATLQAEKYYHTAHDALLYHLPVPHPVPGIHGV